MMNERIKELAEQVYGSAHYDDFKFAELIVKGCASICEDHPAWTGRMIGELIKERFGVE